MLLSLCCVCIGPTAPRAVYILLVSALFCFRSVFHSTGFCRPSCPRLASATALIRSGAYWAEIGFATLFSAVWHRSPPRPVSSVVALFPTCTPRPHRKHQEWFETSLGFRFVHIVVPVYLPVWPGFVSGLPSFFYVLLFNPRYKREF